MRNRGGLQDHLCRFTPPLILHTLDVFPSDQGKFRVSLNLGNHFKCIKGIFEPLTCRCCIGSALAHHLKVQRPTHLTTMKPSAAYLLRCTACRTHAQPSRLKCDVFPTLAAIPAKLRTVRKCARLLLTTFDYQPSRVPCSPLFPFLSSLRLCAAYETRPRCTSNDTGSIYDTSRRAEACKTMFAASHPHLSCPC